MSGFGSRLREKIESTRSNVSGNATSNLHPKNIHGLTRLGGGGSSTTSAESALTLPAVGGSKINPGWGVDPDSVRVPSGHLAGIDKSPRDAKPHAPPSLQHAEEKGVPRERAASFSQSTKSRWGDDDEDDNEEDSPPNGVRTPASPGSHHRASGTNNSRYERPDMFKSYNSDRREMEYNSGRREMEYSGRREMEYNSSGRREMEYNRGRGSSYGDNRGSFSGGNNHSDYSYDRPATEKFRGPSYGDSRGSFSGGNSHSDYSYDRAATERNRGSSYGDNRGSFSGGNSHSDYSYDRAAAERNRGPSSGDSRGGLFGPSGDNRGGQGIKSQSGMPDQSKDSVTSRWGSTNRSGPLLGNNGSRNVLEEKETLQETRNVRFNPEIRDNGKEAIDRGSGHTVQDTMGSDLKAKRMTDPIPSRWEESGNPIASTPTAVLRKNSYEPPRAMPDPIPSKCEESDNSIASAPRVLLRKISDEPLRAGDETPASSAGHLEVSRHSILSGAPSSVPEECPVGEWGDKSSPKQSSPQTISPTQTCVKVEQGLTEQEREERKVKQQENILKHVAQQRESTAGASSKRVSESESDAPAKWERGKKLSLVQDQSPKAKDSICPKVGDKKAKSKITKSKPCRIEGHDHSWNECPNNPKSSLFVRNNPCTIEGHNHDWIDCEHNPKSENYVKPNRKRAKGGKLPSRGATGSTSALSGNETSGNSEIATNRKTGKGDCKIPENVDGGNADIAESSVEHAALGSEAEGQFAETTAPPPPPAVSAWMSGPPPAIAKLHPAHALGVCESKTDDTAMLFTSRQIELEDQTSKMTLVPTAVTPSPIPTGSFVIGNAPSVRPILFPGNFALFGGPHRSPVVYERWNPPPTVITENTDPWKSNPFTPQNDTQLPVDAQIWYNR